MQGKVFETSAETPFDRGQQKRVLAEYPPPALQRGLAADIPTGFRRLTPSLLQADHAAEDFDGLPDGIKHHGELLAAFKAAAPRLGLSVRLVHALDWLFRFTQAQDWEQGRRPVVWPSAATQQEAFVLSESGVRNINRHLVDAGLITMKDSPNGKRYGVRDRHGQIVEAYGFDLSPIATRHAEFVQLAAVAKAKAGKLNLARTIWGLRQAASKPRCNSPRPAPS